MGTYGYYWRTDLTPEEVTLALDALARARSAFHGFSAAVGLAIDTKEKLNLPGLRAALQDHNKTLSELVGKFATGYGSKEEG